MSGTSYLDKKMIDHVTGVVPYAGEPLYLALMSSDPGKAGSQVSEIVDDGYARQLLTGKMGAADAVTGEAVNIAVINFGPAVEAWPIAYLATATSLTGGNLTIIGSPSVPKTIAAGAPFQLVPGQLRIRGN